MHLERDHSPSTLLIPLSEIRLLDLYADAFRLTSNDPHSSFIEETIEQYDGLSWDMVFGESFVGENFHIDGSLMREYQEAFTFKFLWCDAIWIRKDVTIALDMIKEDSQDTPFDVLFDDDVDSIAFQMYLKKIYADRPHTEKYGHWMEGIYSIDSLLKSKWTISSMAPYIKSRSWRKKVLLHDTQH
jgi:hypothetical protein